MVMYLCGRGIIFAYFYCFSIGFWNCFDSVVFLLFFPSFYSLFKIVFFINIFSSQYNCFLDIKQTQFIHIKWRLCASSDVILYIYCMLVREI